MWFFEQNTSNTTVEHFYTESFHQLSRFEFNLALLGFKRTLR
jgi:hypothetical protein